MTPSRLWLCPVERPNMERTLLRAPLEYSNLSVNFKHRARTCPTMRCSRRRGTPSLFQAFVPGAADLVSLGVVTASKAQTFDSQRHRRNPMSFRTVLFAITAVGSIVSSGCATMKPNSIAEVEEITDTNNCKSLGTVTGSNAMLVGLLASPGSKSAKAEAMNKAVDLGATHIVWSQQGTSITNEWYGKAYKCK